MGGLTFQSLALDVLNDNSIIGHTCGVTSSGDAYCWGANGSGQLGDGTLADSPAPVMVNLP